MSREDGKIKEKRLAHFGWYELPENNFVARFCQDSGLHGLKYITEPNQHLFERFFWLVSFIMATIVGSYLIYNTWDQYFNLPVVIVQSPKPLSLKEIPFPSVTVCGLNRVKKKTYDKYVTIANQGDDGDNNTVQEAKDIVKIFDALCHPSNTFSKNLVWKGYQIFGTRIHSAFLGLELSQSFQNESKILKLLKQSSPSCEDLAPAIFFNQLFLPSYNYIKQVETDFGICCTFNTIHFSNLKPWKKLRMFDHKTYSMDTLLPRNATKDNMVFPRQQTLPGITDGLTIFLNTNLIESHCNRSGSNGFLISIAKPLDAPSFSDKDIVLEFNTETSFILQPKITLADHSIKRFTPEKRGCYFEKEFTLRDYSVYTKANCLQECVAHLSMEHCQVLADCWDDTRVEMGVLGGHWIYDHLCKKRQNCNLTKFDESFNLNSDAICKHCLPTCSDIKYAYYTQVKHFMKDDFHQIFDDSSTNPYQSFLPRNQQRNRDMGSLVHLYFDDFDYTPIIRKEQFGILELLANSGGLLGLCLGFSGISILEIIYYFTIRVCFRRFRRNVILKNGLGQDDSNPNDNANEISYLHMMQADNEVNMKQLQTTQADNELIIRQLQTSMAELQQIVMGSAENCS